MAVTPDEARAIADAFQAAADAGDAYLNANYQKISRSEYEFLYESCSTLQNAATFATTEAVGLALDAMVDPVTEITNVIINAKEQINVVKTVGCVIKLAAGLADLAASIIAKDPGAIVTSVTNFDKLLQPLLQGDSSSC